MAIDLYYFPPSPPCWSVRMLAKQLGISLNLHEVDVLKGDQFEDEFKKMNPKHTIPTIDDDGFILWESRAILIYLVMKYAENDSLYPNDPEKRAIIENRLYSELGNLYECVSSYFYPVITMGRPSPPEECLAPMEESFRLFDGLLQGSDFLAGDGLTIADYGLMSTVSTAKALDYDINQFKNVSAWYNRCKEAMEDGFEEITENGMRELSDLYKPKIQVSE